MTNRRKLKRFKKYQNPNKLHKLACRVLKRALYAFEHRKTVKEALDEIGVHKSVLIVGELAADYKQFTEYAINYAKLNA